LFQYLIDCAGNVVSDSPEPEGLPEPQSGETGNDPMLEDTTASLTVKDDEAEQYLTWRIRKAASQTQSDPEKKRYNELFDAARNWRSDKASTETLEQLLSVLRVAEQDPLGLSSDDTL
jgi:hypothetical protein